MGRLLLSFTLIAIVVLVVGFYRGWFGLTSKNYGSETNMTFKVDKKKMTEDVGSAGKAVQNLFTNNNAAGRIATVNADERSLTITMEKDKRMTFLVDDATKIRRGEKEIHLSDLANGESVTVAYREDKEQRTAVTITVEKQ